MKMWFRVELNKDGSIKACDTVNEPGKDSDLVSYVNASAVTESIDWRKRFNARRAIRVRAMRERAAKENICQSCLSVPTVKGKIRCNNCLIIAKKNQAARRARLTEAHVNSVSSLKTIPTLSERYLFLLREVRSEYQGRKSDSFIVWLNTRVKTLEKQAKFARKQRRVNINKKSDD